GCRATAPTGLGVADANAADGSVDLCGFLSCQASNLLPGRLPKPSFNMFGDNLPRAVRHNYPPFPPYGRPSPLSMAENMTDTEQRNHLTVRKWQRFGKLI